MKQPDWGMGTKKISQFDRPTREASCHGKQISVYTRELAPETDSCNRFATCSLLPHIKPVSYEVAKLENKSFVVQHIFSLEIVGADEGALLWEYVARVCCGSKLTRVYRPLLTDETLALIYKRSKVLELL